jgi:hypothetical protein
MNHLQQFPVKFESSITRQIVKDGVIVKYFRNNFTVDGKVYSVSSPEDLQGLKGTVAFVKAGELGPDGKTPVVQNAFSLLGVTSIQGLRNALETKRLENETKGMD